MVHVMRFTSALTSNINKRVGNTFKLFKISLFYPEFKKYFNIQANRLACKQGEKFDAGNIPFRMIID